jgi:type IV pilus assembly protein PilC
MVMFGQVPLASLIEFCRAVRYNLGAGLPIRRVFRQQAEKGPIAIRPIAGRIADQIEQGQSVTSALEKEKRAFPPIFISLGSVGEQSGNLPEILGELEKYFVLQLRLRRDFLSQITWPVIQLVLAILVIAGMIYVLSILNPNFSPLGKTFSGEQGAVLWLVLCFGTIAGLIALYYILTRSLKQKVLVDRLLLRLPVIGPCMQALALMRFCTALRLTMETGMGISSALRLSMRATGNAAYAAETDRVRGAVRGGQDLVKALERCDLFPGDFLDIVSTAEEGGRVPEVMHHQADYYEDETRRRMTILTRASSWGIYFLVAAFIIFLIFRIFTVAYLGTINQFM